MQRMKRGAARGFRLRDPSDFSSQAMTGTPTANDQLLGLGDGVTASFPLLKRYGEGEAEQLRRITRPRADSVQISVDGVPVTGWTLDPEMPVPDNVVPIGTALSNTRLYVLDAAAGSFERASSPSVPAPKVRPHPRHSHLWRPAASRPVLTKAGQPHLGQRSGSPPPEASSSAMACRRASASLLFSASGILRT